MYAPNRAVTDRVLSDAERPREGAGEYSAVDGEGGRYISAQATIRPTPGRGTINKCLLAPQVTSPTFVFLGVGGSPVQLILMRSKWHIYLPIYKQRVNWYLQLGGFQAAPLV